MLSLKRKYRREVQGDLAITLDGFDWLAQGFLAGQEVFIDGFPDQSWEVVEVVDAIEMVSDGMGGFIEIQNPNDNSILVLSGPPLDPTLDGSSDVLITAVDALVNVLLGVDIAGNTEGGVVTRLDGANWEDDGFLQAI